MKYLVALLLACGIVSNANAAFKIGLLSVPLEHKFKIYDLTADSNSQGTDTASISAIMFSGEYDEAINDNVAFGLSAGGGVGQAGTYTFKGESAFTGLGSTTNPGEGYSDLLKPSGVASIMAQVIFSAKMLGGVTSLGIGGGVIALGINIQSKTPTNTTMSTLAEVSSQLGITPGYTLGVSDNLSMGLEVPLAFVEEMNSQNNITDSKGDYTDGYRMGGGMSWGVNLVFKKKI